MLSLVVMLVLIVVAGWLDSRLNWQPAGRDEQEVKRS
jgi:glucose-6-phosphate dehydrogenase assembly protein OpcA